MTYKIPNEYLFLFTMNQDGTNSFMGPYNQRILHSVIPDFLWDKSAVARGVVSASDFNAAECDFLFHWDTYGRDGRWKSFPVAREDMPVLSDPRRFTTLTENDIDKYIGSTG